MKDLEFDMEAWIKNGDAIGKITEYRERFIEMRSHNEGFSYLIGKEVVEGNVKCLCCIEPKPHANPCDALDAAKGVIDAQLDTDHVLVAIIDAYKETMKARNMAKALKKRVNSAHCLVSTLAGTYPENEWLDIAESCLLEALEYSKKSADLYETAFSKMFEEKNSRTEMKGDA